MWKYAGLSHLGIWCGFLSARSFASMWSWLLGRLNGFWICCYCCCCGGGVHSNRWWRACWRRWVLTASCCSQLTRPTSSSSTGCTKSRCIWARAACGTKSPTRGSTCSCPRRPSSALTCKCWRRWWRRISVVLSLCTPWTNPSKLWTHSGTSLLF